MEKINYQKELDKILADISSRQNSEKPNLLLHACCGPCSSYVIEYLSSIFNIKIYYYNPNIHPAEEYYRRLNELKKFLTVFPDAVKNQVQLVEDHYDPEEYFAAVNTRNEVELCTEAEKGERCRRCYRLRMERAWQYACRNNFDWFTTTLSISPHKDSQKINAIGLELDKEFAEKVSQGNILSRTKFLPSDFKKNGGFLRSTQLTTQYGLWRQDYCGCIYSMRNKK